MSWRNTIIFFSLSVGTLASMLSYYKFDLTEIASLSFYQNLANPSVRIVQIQEGLRKEEIAEVIAIKLEWSDQEKDNFINGHLALNSGNLEGKYFPKTYMLSKDEDPMGVTALMLKQFTKETATIKKQKTMQVVKEETAVKIASIIQREAAGKSDMKLISGIIWNRLWAGMKLQIDATLQYAKGSEENGWWRQVSSKDKKIDSPYNTYIEAGLPPSAIANPGLAALEAAYNPQKTTCLFYLHDKNRKIHCAKTYEEHKRNIAKYL
jgi:UPF0755 protein